MKLDRRRLETAHLLYAFLTIQVWYPNAFGDVQYKAGDLDGVLLDITPMYHSIFSKVYAGENNKQYLIVIQNIRVHKVHGNQFGIYLDRCKKRYQLPRQSCINYAKGVHLHAF